MKKLEEKIINIVNNMNGSLLGIGITSKRITDAIEKNDNIINCNLLDSYNKKTKLKGKKNKKIYLKKLKKIYKREKAKYVLYDINALCNHIRTFIKINIFINDGITYIYGNYDIYDVDKLIKRYRRYTKKIEIEKIGQNYIITIDNTNSKNNKLKEFFYSMIDILTDAMDLVGDVLVN